MWRLWTNGWGVRAWWFWFTTEGFPMWVAWALPRRIALWAFVRVSAATGDSPDQITYAKCYAAWERGEGR